MSPVLSFIIPTLNEEKILERTLTSIRTLKAFPFEIVISDGNSKDQTLPIARRLADKVVVWDKPTRQTIAMARNMGAHEAAGQYYVYLDADVIIPNMDEFFTAAVERFAKDPKLAALTAWRSVLPEFRTVADSVNFAVLSFGIYAMNNFLRLPNSYGEFQMLRADKFREVGGYDERLIAAEDMDMFIRMAKVGKTRLDPSLTFFETGRRVHKMGWPRAWMLWLGTGVSTRWLGRNRDHAWEVIR
jgi:glycosyltransferase involved in cell wall biosynthesis